MQREREREREREKEKEKEIIHGTRDSGGEEAGSCGMMIAEASTGLLRDIP